MITPAGEVRIRLAVEPVDFRKGIDGLAAVVQERLGRNPFSGELFVFRAKRADRVKILMWDGTGAVLYHKRLEQSRFRWPAARPARGRAHPGAAGDAFGGARLGSNERQAHEAAASRCLRHNFYLTEFVLFDICLV